MRDVELIMDLDHSTMRKVLFDRFRDHYNIKMRLQRTVINDARNQISLTQSDSRMVI
jgi:hypothetical protein